LAPARSSRKPLPDYVIAGGRAGPDHQAQAAGWLMKVLFLTHRLPYAPNRGDRNRALLYLLHAMSQFAEVSLFSAHQ
jgi:hypothetical protein